MDKINPGTLPNSPSAGDVYCRPVPLRERMALPAHLVADKSQAGKPETDKKSRPKHLAEAVALVLPWSPFPPSPSSVLPTLGTAMPLPSDAVAGGDAQPVLDNPNIVVLRQPDVGASPRQDSQQLPTPTSAGTSAPLAASAASAVPPIHTSPALPLAENTTALPGHAPIVRVMEGDVSSRSKMATAAEAPLNTLAAPALPPSSTPPVTAATLPPAPRLIAHLAARVGRAAALEPSRELTYRFNWAGNHLATVRLGEAATSTRIWPSTAAVAVALSRSNIDSTWRIEQPEATDPDGRRRHSRDQQAE